MNREILFRGKRFDNDEWVYGYYCSNDVGNHFMVVTKDDEDNFCFEHIEVDENTVCQYTGLTDKNGNKIFEGDIVSTIDDGIKNPNYVVIFDSDELDFKATNGKENYYTNYVYISGCDEIEVIGNIFDNPELLDDTKKRMIQ